MLKASALFVLLAANLAVGQSMTSNSSGTWNTPAIISNFPDCTTGGVDCYHDMKVTASKVFSDNETTYKLDSSGHVSLYNDKLNTWSAHAEYGAVQVIHQVGNVLYGLVHSAGSSGYYLSKWSGTTWTDISCCFEDFSVAPDASGLVVLHDASGTIWVSKDGGHTVSKLPYCNPYPVSSEAALGLDYNNNPAFVVACENKTIWQYSNLTWTQMPGAAKQVGIDRSGRIYMLDLSGYVNHWTGSKWEKLNGPATTFLANGGQLNVWTISGGELYDFSDTGIDWSRTFSGTVTCNVPPPYNQQICPTFTHTVKVQLKTGKKVGAVATAVPWTSSGSWGVTAHVHTNDSFDCWLNASDPNDCLVGENAGEMNCSAGSGQKDMPPDVPTPVIERAYGKAEFLGAAPEWSWFPPSYVYQPLGDMCIQSIQHQWPPDDIDINAEQAVGGYVRVSAFSSKYYKAFYVYMRMISFDVDPQGNPHWPWVPFTLDNEFGLDGEDPPGTNIGPDMYCTYNP